MHLNFIEREAFGNWEQRVEVASFDCSVIFCSAVVQLGPGGHVLYVKRKQRLDVDVPTF
uniref:Uncharacterized protein n=1 Tax=Nelumbo nucifera TaxID=4432 RepID=A0A822YTL4_NELNU|nr:TPA_asm: hypothetical protein HUJ06_005105 [Nelumbo nucifera]